GAVVDAAPEPAVVDDEHLDAHGGGLVGKRRLALGGDVEQRRVPGIVDDRRHIGTARAEIVADEIVERPAHGAEALLGMTEDGAAVAAAVGEELPVAAPLQGAEPEPARLLAGGKARRAALDGETGHAAMRGGHAPALALEDAVDEGLALHAELVAPAAVEVI